MIDDTENNSDIEEKDILSIFAEQGEEAEEIDELDDEVDNDGELPSTVEELQALVQKEREIVNKRNVSLRKSKAATKRVLEEKSSLESRFDQLEEKINGTTSTASTEVERQQAEQQAQDWKQRIDDDPSESAAYVDWKQDQLEKRLGSYLENFTAVVTGKLDGLNQRTDPDMVKHQATVNKLKSLPQFEGLDEKALLVVAKSFDGVKVGPRGGVGGGSKVESKTVNPNDSVLTPEQKLAMGF